MEGQARVLQQRVEAVAFDRHRHEPLERVRGEEQEGVEAEPDHRLRGQGRDQGPLRQPPLEQGDAGAGNGEHRHPEQHRAFVIPPRAGELVEPGLLGMAVRRDQLHRKVGAQEQPDQRQEGDRREQALRDRDRPDPAEQPLAVRPQRGRAEEQLEKRQGRRQPERRESCLGDHSSDPLLCFSPAASAGM